jgi:hypothetical protein
MKLNFSGWRRRVKSHSHKIIPIDSTGGMYRTKPAGPLVWASSKKVFGKVSGMGLTGDFLLEVELEDSELRSWLERFVHERPEIALPLLCEMQAKAVLALHHRPHIADSDAE